MINKKNRNLSVAAKSVAMKKPESFFADQPPEKIEMAPARLHQLTRRDVLLFGAGALAALSGAGFLLPQNTLSRLGVRIGDHVPHLRNEDNAASTIPASVPEPSPSWILAFTEPVSITTHQFKNSLTPERIVLGFSMLALAFAILFVPLRFTSVIVLGFVFLFISALNYGIWSFRFRSDLSVITKKAVASELKTFEDKVRMIRTLILSREADKKSIRERHLLEQSKNARELEAARQDEQKELNAVQTAFQLEMNPISNGRRELMKQETDRLQNISSTLAGC
jgi:hypothetical protein